MKKIALLGVLLLSLGFVSCDEVEENTARPQENPQLPIFNSDKLDITAAEGTLNLQALLDESQAVTLGTISAEDFPFSEYELKLVGEMANDNTFKGAAQFAAKMTEEGTLTASVADVEAAFVKAISKGPKEKTVNVRYAAYAHSGSTEVRIGNADTYFGEGTLTILPLAGEIVIEESYYLVGTACDWTVADAIKFNHSDANQYDDPVFTLKVDISEDQAAAGWWWKILPGSAVEADGWDGQLGVIENGDTALEGMLTSDDPGAGCIDQPGQYLITINLEESTYEFSSAIQYLYTPGNAQGWDPASANKLFTNDYAAYMGFAHLNGEWKITTAPDWGHTNYGVGAEEGTLDAAGGNLSVDVDGCYWVKANIASLTYSATQITSLGIIGDLNSWSAQIALNPSADFMVWEGDVEFTGDGGWKIRCNDDWGINLGGDVNDLTLDGANIPSPAAGTHHVVLNLSQVPYTITVD